MAAGDFYRIVSAAIRDFAEHGFDSERRLTDWLRKIRMAIDGALIPLDVVERSLQQALVGTYTRQVDKGGALRGIPARDRYTLAQVKPQLRAELDRRIAASAGLIRLNRADAIEKTIRRFSGWATSIPAGGSNAVDRREESMTIRKALSSLPFTERRVVIDQGNKLSAAIKDIVAVDAGAIAGVWDVVHAPGYDHRPEHLARAGKVFIVPGSWADQQGFFAAKAPRTTDVEQPAVEPYCRCSWRYVFAVRDIPEPLLSAKGKKALAAAQMGRPAAS